MINTILAYHASGIPTDRQEYIEWENVKELLEEAIETRCPVTRKLEAVEAALEFHEERVPLHYSVEYKVALDLMRTVQIGL
jgi:hypothetical protein